MNEGPQGPRQKVFWNKWQKFIKIVEYRWKTLKNSGLHSISEYNYYVHILYFSMFYPRLNMIQWSEIFRLNAFTNERFYTWQRNIFAKRYQVNPLKVFCSKFPKWTYSISIQFITFSFSFLWEGSNLFNWSPQILH